VFSHFNGSDVFHVFGRLSKKVREELPKAKGALVQEKVLRINVELSENKEDIFASMLYGLRLADTIDFCFKKNEEKLCLYR